MEDYPLQDVITVRQRDFRYNGIHGSVLLDIDVAIGIIKFLGLLYAASHPHLGFHRLCIRTHLISMIGHQSCKGRQGSNTIIKSVKGLLKHFIIDSSLQ